MNVNVTRILEDHFKKLNVYSVYKNLNEEQKQLLYLSFIEGYKEGGSDEQLEKKD